MAQETADHPTTGDDPDRGFTAFYGNFRRKLLSSALLYTGDPHEAEDLTQEAMATAFKHWRKLYGRSAGERFNFVKTTMIRNAIRSARRAEKFRKISPKIFDSDHVNTVESTALGTIGEGEALSMIVALPPRQRIVMVLIWDGYSVAEIAAEMNLSPSAVRSHLQQARAHLKARAAHQNGGTNARP